LTRRRGKSGEAKANLKTGKPHSNRETEADESEIFGGGGL